MEKINYGISLKNIPKTNKWDYFAKLVLQTEDLIRRMQWRAHFFLLDQEESYKYENYGFKNLKTTPLIKALAGFEIDLLEIINGLNFHKSKKLLQTH